MQPASIPSGRAPGTVLSLDSGNLISGQSNWRLLDVWPTHAPKFVYGSRAPGKPAHPSPRLVQQRPSGPAAPNRAAGFFPRWNTGAQGSSAKAANPSPHSIAAGSLVLSPTCRSTRSYRPTTLARASRRWESCLVLSRQRAGHKPKAFIKNSLVELAVREECHCGHAQALRLLATNRDTGLGADTMKDLCFNKAKSPG